MTEPFDPIELLDQLPDPVLVLDGDARLRWANQAATEALGWQLSEWAGRPVTLLVHPDDAAVAVGALGTIQAKDLGTPIELRVQTADERWCRVEVRGRSAVQVGGVHGIVLVLRDITDRRRWELARGDGQVLASLIDAIPVIVVHADPDGFITTVTPAQVRTLGHDLEAVEHRPFIELVLSEDRELVADALREAAAAPVTRHLEARLMRVDGIGVPHALTVVGLVNDPVVAGLVVTAQDITALVEARSRFRYLATHDELTGLANRAALLDRLDQLLGDGAEVAVVFVDLDGFKAVNDGYGHQAGDVVLVALARRLASAAAGALLTARLGGDEFVTVYCGSNALERAAVAVRDIAAALIAPVALPSHAVVSVSATFGVAGTSRERAVTANDLLGDADRSMYAAKRARPSP